MRQSLAAMNIISFDVEEYFQVEAAAVERDQWEIIPGRLEPVIDDLLNLLEEHRTEATFFILGWVAQKYPDMVRRIAGKGHEIATHGMSHTMVNKLTPAAYRKEIRDSRQLLEDLAGEAVTGYRAPTFSITHRTAWALDILAEEGFQYDSSIFPIRHDRYGVPEAPVEPHYALGPAGNGILEIPPLTMKVLGSNIPVGGGGYLRLLPVRLVEIALNKVNDRRRGGMMYLHPWEFDPEQPRLPMSRSNRWRHRVGLGRTRKKLARLLERYCFGSVRNALPSLRDSATQRFIYGTSTSALQNGQGKAR